MLGIIHYPTGICAVPCTVLRVLPTTDSIYRLDPGPRGLPSSGWKVWRSLSCATCSKKAGACVSCGLCPGNPGLWQLELKSGGSMGSGSSLVPPRSSACMWRCDQIGGDRPVLHHPSGPWLCSGPWLPYPELQHSYRVGEGVADSALGAAVIVQG